MGKALETMIRVRNSIHELISRGMPDHREFVEKERALSRAISGLEPILFQEDLREDDDEASRILLLMAEEIAAWGVWDLRRVERARACPGSGGALVPGGVEAHSGSAAHRGVAELSR